MVYHLCLSPCSFELCICGYICTTKDTHRVFKPGIAKRFLGKAPVNIAKLQTKMLPPHSVISTALGMVPCACRRQGCSCPNPYCSGGVQHERNQFLASHCGEVAQWMEEAGWLQELSAAPENTKRQVSKRQIQKKKSTKRQLGRRQMGNEWWEGLAGAGDGVRMLEGTCSAFHARCTFSGLMACSKAAVKAGFCPLCFKALTQSCLKGLYMFVRGWKQKCE